MAITRDGSAARGPRVAARGVGDFMRSAAFPAAGVGASDDRTYGYTIAVRVADSLDAMTADWTRLPLEVLGRISARIVNEVAGVNRVVYDISSKPPSTIEWE